MTVKAYVLITSASKEVKNVVETLRASKIVQSAEAVTGPYDIITLVEADSVDALGQLVTQEILSIDGIERTLTCITLGM